MLDGHYTQQAHVDSEFSTLNLLLEAVHHQRNLASHGHDINIHIYPKWARTQASSQKHESWYWIHLSLGENVRQIEKCGKPIRKSDFIPAEQPSGTQAYVYVTLFLLIVFLLGISQNQIRRYLAAFSFPLELRISDGSFLRQIYFTSMGKGLPSYLKVVLLLLVTAELVHMSLWVHDASLTL